MKKAGIALLACLPLMLAGAWFCRVKLAVKYVSEIVMSLGPNFFSHCGTGRENELYVTSQIEFLQSDEFLQNTAAALKNSDWHQMQMPKFSALNEREKFLALKKSLKISSWRNSFLVIVKATGDDIHETEGLVQFVAFNYASIIAARDAANHLERRTDFLNAVEKNVRNADDDIMPRTKCALKLAADSYADLILQARTEGVDDYDFEYRLPQSEPLRLAWEKYKGAKEDAESKALAADLLYGTNFGGSRQRWQEPIVVMNFRPRMLIDPQLTAAILLAAGAICGVAGSVLLVIAFVKRR